MRLDKLLSNMGYGSRKDMKKFLKSGQVFINEKVVKDGKTQVDPQKDVITVAGEVVEYKEFVYFMLHKPQGVVSATEDNRDRTVVDLLEEEDQIFEVFPVGRLDKDTEGLLLLTNDGKLAHELLAPKKHIPKTYFAHIEGKVTEEDILAFEEGVVLEDGYKTLPAQLVIEESGELSKILLTIYEGKFHQVKRMFLAQGKKVVYLKRVSMGPLQLDPALPLGQYRELTEAELDLLRNRE